MLTPIVIKTDLAIRITISIISVVNRVILGHPEALLQLINFFIE